MELNQNLTSGNATVDRMHRLNLTPKGSTGNYIPNTWYKSIHYDNGKPDFIACIILSEIVYWYKPKITCDEKTGDITKIEKKFYDDLLQKSYSELADTYGISKQQATNAVNHLVKLGIIKRVFRTINTHGIRLSNVMYIDLNIDSLIHITYPDGNLPTDSRTNNVSNPRKKDVLIEKDTPTNIDLKQSISKESGLTTKDATNTKNTSYYTTKITSSMQDSVDEERTYNSIIAENIRLEELLSEFTNEKERLEMLYNIICSVVNSKQKKRRINKEELPQNAVKSVFLNIRKAEILYVLDILNAPKEKPIKNVPKYIETLLYNSTIYCKENTTQKSNISPAIKETPKNSFNNFTQRNYTDEELAEFERIGAR